MHSNKFRRTLFWANLLAVPVLLLCVYLLRPGADALDSHRQFIEATKQKKYGAIEPLPQFDYLNYETIKVTRDPFGNVIQNNNHTDNLVSYLSQLDPNLLSIENNQALIKVGDAAYLVVRGDYMPILNATVTDITKKHITLRFNDGVTEERAVKLLELGTGN